MDPVVNPQPAAPAAQEPAPAKPAASRQKFADPTADLVGQILPHLKRVKDNAEDAGDKAAIAHARGGRSDAALAATCDKSYARANLYAGVIKSLLADPLLTPDVVQWYHNAIEPD